VSILLLISRSKLVLDFALTLHFIHLVVVSLYSKSIPQNMLWWALQVASAAMMTSLGVWSCQYRELRPINFGGSAQGTTGESSMTALTHEGGDEEQGYGRGRGRGRGRDGAGEYEMVGMKADGEAT
jgi:protein SYS1